MYLSAWYFMFCTLGNVEATNMSEAKAVTAQAEDYTERLHIEMFEGKSPRQRNIVRNVTF